jgi:hypothetical protein
LDAKVEPETVQPVEESKEAPEVVEVEVEIEQPALEAQSSQFATNAVTTNGATTR